MFAGGTVGCDQTTQSEPEDAAAGAGGVGFRPDAGQPNANAGAGGASVEGGAGGTHALATGGSGGAAGASEAAGGSGGGIGGRAAGGRPGGGGSAGVGGSFSSGAAGGLGAGGATGTGGLPAHTGTWRIMPLGDSITGSTCYPQLLSKQLIANGHTDFTFIGTNLNNQSCGSNAPSLMTEGHGGYDVTYLTTKSPPASGHGTLAELQSWAAEKPDVVLMEYGTNDVWNGYSLSSVLSAYGFVVDQFRSQKPNVVFFVAQITPLHPSGCGSCEANVEALNAQIPSWASGKASAASPIYVVDVWAALPEATYQPKSEYTSDGVHPNPAGAQLVANAWYAGLVAKGLP